MEIPSQLPFPVILLSYYNLYYPLQTTRTTPFCCKTFLNSVPTARCCYCYGAVSPSLHTFLLFKKFPQFLVYLRPFPSTLLSCPWRLGISGKWEMSFYTMGTEYSENKRKTKYFQPSELPMNLRLSGQSSPGDGWNIVLVF